MLFKTFVVAGMIACFIARFGGLAVAQAAKGDSPRQFELVAESPKFWDLSPDGKRLYVNDTRKQAIRVYDVGANMKLQNGRLFGKEEGRGGVPDGLRVDVKGNVYCTGPGGVWVWDPEGNHLGTVMLPESTANFNWGDADYSTIYFSSRTSIYRLKTKARGFVGGVKNSAAK